MLIIVEDGVYTVNYLNIWQCLCEVELLDRDIRQLLYMYTVGIRVE